LPSDVGKSGCSIATGKLKWCVAIVIEFLLPFRVKKKAKEDIPFALAAGAARCISEVALG